MRTLREQNLGSGLNPRIIFPVKSPFFNLNFQQSAIAWVNWLAGRFWQRCDVYDELLYETLRERLRKVFDRFILILTFHGIWKVRKYHRQQKFSQSPHSRKLFESLNTVRIDFKTCGICSS
ncbi:hypothetical protein [Nostoc sp.]|uniref:hypothetical protein n=1 Tax=Nostoc sp. TaxID=1180 RepID=UPI002FF255BA